MNSLEIAVNDQNDRTVSKMSAPPKSPDKNNPTQEQLPGHRPVALPPTWPLPITRLPALLPPASLPRVLHLLITIPLRLPGGSTLVMSTQGPGSQPGPRSQSCVLISLVRRPWREKSPMHPPAPLLPMKKKMTTSQSTEPKNGHAPHPLPLPTRRLVVRIPPAQHMTMITLQHQ